MMIPVDEGRETTGRSVGHDAHVVRCRASTARGRARRLWSPLLVAVTAWGVLIVSGLAIRASTQAEALDDALARWTVAVSPAWSVGPARALDVLLGPRAMAVLLILLAAAVGLMATGDRRTRILAGLRTAAAGAGAWGLEALAKRIVDRPRPGVLASDVGAVPLPGSASYPSGHTACAAILATLLALAVLRRGDCDADASGDARRERGAAAAVVMLGALLTVATAWSRVRLGVHHPSDVLASLLLLPPLAAGLLGVLAGGVLAGGVLAGSGAGRIPAESARVAAPLGRRDDRRDDRGAQERRSGDAPEHPHPHPRGDRDEHVPRLGGP
ncbi:phosphatase PAP2 family protein [Brachybacterium nesterenkovii]|uniref:phosphatase PAP2 family protein n=1 Tax=Brachybacterium nesterenkovii TaxID=47847 RepID=UPI000B360444|nr:phosphatase PAP2 family protein [Brachybacterium nesterenkovii]